MNKRILLTLFFVLTVVLSVGTIYASDVNNADSYTSVYDEPLTESIDDSSSVSVYDSNVDSDSQNDVSESEDSNTLSTNIDESNNLISDEYNLIFKESEWCDDIYMDSIMEVFLGFVNN